MDGSWILREVVERSGGMSLKREKTDYLKYTILSLALGDNPEALMNCTTVLHTGLDQQSFTLVGDALYVLVPVRNIDDFTSGRNTNNLRNMITLQPRSQMLCDSGYRVCYIYTFFHSNLSQYFVDPPLALITALQRSRIDSTHFNCSQRSVRACHS